MGCTPRSTSQVLSVTAYVRKEALNPRRKLECTCTRMMGNLLIYNLESGFQDGMWDLCWESVVKFLETLKRRCVDICCLQEVRWKGQGAKMIGNGFKFLWSGSCKAENGVGVIVANWLIGKIVGIERFNDRVMKVNIVIGDVVWEVVSCYCPQTGRSVNEKEEFYELMDKVVTSEQVLMGGSDMGGFGEVHECSGIGK